MVYNNSSLKNKHTSIFCNRFSDFFTAMPYKPKFCCECGEPIERVGWALLTSRRFCELCETEYKLDDWIPRATVAAGILFGIFGLGTFLQKAEKPLSLASGNSTNINKSAVNTQISVEANVQSFAKTQEANLVVAQSSAKPPIAQPKPASKVQKVENQQSAAQETMYFCGAETKKGTLCRHLVKGGRCWQHAGKPAMLPPEKLVANR